jgi:hypothetical protein
MFPAAYLLGPGSRPARGPTRVMPLGSRAGQEPGPYGYPLRRLVAYRFSMRSRRRAASGSPPALALAR